VPELRRHEDVISFDVTGDGRQTIVFLHNLMTDRDVWSAQAARLRDRFRVVRIDARGHGRSTARAPFTIGDLVDDVVAVFDLLALERAVVAGLSIGASTATELALARPSRVRGLVLLSPSPVASTRFDSVRSVLFARTVRALGMRNDLARQATDYLFGSSFRSERPDVVTEWEARICALDPLGAYHALRAWDKRPRVLERLEKIVAPCLVVVGEEDTANPPRLGELTCSRIPGARLCNVARAGHTMPVERPGEIGVLVEDFVNALGPA
jgi:3-oxoadipate enol-lactonase